jgi:hypothetical protein
MRIQKYLPLIAALALMLSACHANKTFTQTFESEKDPGQTLTLTSRTGLIHPNAGFPHNVFFKVFGGGEVEGTYEQKTATGTVKGTFTAGKESEKQWIKFKPAEGVGDKTEWKVQVKLGGMLANGDTIWFLKKTYADAKAASSFKMDFGGN